MINIHSRPGSGILLHRDDSAVPAIEIREQGGMRWLHFGGHAVQSAMRLQQPAEVVLPYLQCMLTALVFNPKPTRLLNLGLGGGAFNRFFQQHMPGLDITSVEQDLRIVAIAEQYFGVDCRGCRVATAEQFLTQAVAKNAGNNVTAQSDAEQAYDLVLCDLYAEDAVPNVLLMPQTYHQLETLTTNSAILAINLLPASEQDVLAVLQLVRTAFPAIALLEVPDYRNIIVLAAPHALTQQQSPANLEKWIPELEVFLSTLRRVPVRES